VWWTDRRTDGWNCYSNSSRKTSSRPSSHLLVRCQFVCVRLATGQTPAAAMARCRVEPPSAVQKSTTGLSCSRPVDDVTDLWSVLYSVQVRKLKRELDAAHEKISTLTAQLSTNVRVSSLFMQMVLDASAEKKSYCSNRKLTFKRKYVQAGRRFGWRPGPNSVRCLIHRSVSKSVSK